MATPLAVQLRVNCLGHGKAHAEEDGAEVLEGGQGGVGGDEGGDDGAAMAGEVVAAGDLVRDELEVGGLRAGKEGRKAGLGGLGP